jgi:hypothetical protein
MPANQLIITVSGGDTEENTQLSDVVSACLREHRFTNVRVDAPGRQGGYSLSDLVRVMHPAFLNTPVRIVPAEPEEPMMGAFDFTAGKNIQPVDFRFAM